MSAYLCTAKRRPADAAPEFVGIVMAASTFAATLHLYALGYTKVTARVATDAERLDDAFTRAVA